MSRLGQLTPTLKSRGEELAAKGDAIDALLERGDKLLGIELTIKIEVGGKLFRTTGHLGADPPRRDYVPYWL